MGRYSIGAGSGSGPTVVFLVNGLLPLCIKSSERKKFLNGVFILITSRSLCIFVALKWPWLKKVLIKHYTSRHIRKHTCEHVHPAKIQISLYISAVWSEISLGAFWIAKDTKFLYADNEDYGYHYENMPIQIYWKFYHQKMKNLRKLIFLIFLLKT